MNRITTKAGTLLHQFSELYNLECSDGHINSCRAFVKREPYKLTAAWVSDELLNEAISAVAAENYTVVRSASNKGKKLPPEPLNGDEVLKLIKACNPRVPTGIRNRALLVMMYRAGLRVSETLALKPKDLSPEECCVRILHGKGDKSRTVGLDAGSWSIIQRWLDKRSALGINGHKTVYCTLKGGPVSPRNVQQLLTRLGKKCGIEKRVHPHGLRHTLASELDREGVRVRIIQQQLGHSSVATTDAYLRNLHPQEVIEAIRDREWRL